MKVLVAGAAGAIGRQLVPLLVAEGHDVVGMTRSESNREAIELMGARAVIADALDADAVAEAVATAAPEAIAHELTALSGNFDMRHFDRFFELTNRLRTEATDHLLSAAQAVGVRRFVAQSFAGWPAIRGGDAVKTEDAPYDPEPAAQMRRALAAIRYLEQAVTGAEWTEGIVLRYGGFYGPGTSLGPAEGDFTELIRKRRLPVIGDGAGVWSFVHIADAAEATAIALAGGRRGIYNIVDDEPAPVADWLPEVARQMEVKPPRRFPLWLGRLLAGEAATVMMTEVSGASNEKAKRELGWVPSHPTWRRSLVGGAA
jgi:nucleoside-diphosphate-sugar epimerase